MADWKTGELDTSPQEAKYDASKLVKIRDHYGSRIDSGKIQAASFLMARDGKIFAHEAAGTLTCKPGSPPFLPDSIKRIASITKLMTASAVMKLVEDGKIWLEQPVKEIIPEFDTPMHSKITIRHLLTHTSGLTADGGYFLEPYPRDWENSDDAQAWLKQVLTGPLQSEPGHHWAYCSRGFSILAEIVSRVSGGHFNEFTQKNLFEPLGMTRTSMEPPERLWPEVSIMADWEEAWLQHAGERKGIPSGGGGAFSCLRDLFRFGQMTLNQGELGGRVLGKKTIQEMTRNQLSGIPAFHWGKRLPEFRHGLGWGFFCDGALTGPETFNHQGWGASYLFVDPVERFIFTLFVVDPHDWNPELLVEPVNIAFSGIL